MTLQIYFISHLFLSSHTLFHFIIVSLFILTTKHTLKESHQMLQHVHPAYPFLFYLVYPCFISWMQPSSIIFLSLELTRYYSQHGMIRCH